MNYLRALPPSLALAILLAGCGGSSTPTTVTATTTATPNAIPTSAAPAIEVTAGASHVVTPSLTEGPYYPPDKPADRDNDLTLVTGSTEPASGQALAIDGLLLWDDGSPVTGAVVEIWQTDDQGIYLHPGDRRLADRDQNFQSYGESITDAVGKWEFLTIVPGLYEGRPRHIHLKVRIDGAEQLTSQILFAGDPQLANDGVVRSLSDEELVAITIDPLSSGEGQPLHADYVLALAR